MREEIYFFNRCVSKRKAFSIIVVSGDSRVYKVLFVLGCVRLEFFCGWREGNWKVGEFEVMR